MAYVSRISTTLIITEGRYLPSTVDGFSETLPDRRFYGCAVLLFANCFLILFFFVANGWMIRFIQAMTNCGLQCRLRFDESTGDGETILGDGIPLLRTDSRKRVITFLHSFLTIYSVFFWTNQPYLIGFVRVLIFLLLISIL